MKVLVTGGTGFLGYHLSLALTAEGFKTTALGRNASVGADLESHGVQFRKVDLRDSKSMISACKDQDYVIHSGAFSSPWGRYEDFYQMNVGGTQNVISGCLAHQVQRLIHVSTPSIYFDFTNRMNIHETATLPAKQVNAYAQTKLLAEQEIENALRQGLAVISFRPRGIIGPGDRAVVPRLLKVCEKLGAPLVRGGTVWTDVTYVGNVVDALILGLKAPNSLVGRIFNLTNDEPIQFGPLFKILFNKLGYPFKARGIPYKSALALASLLEMLSEKLMNGEEPLITRYSVGLIGVDMTLDITAAKQELGYEPRISVEEGLERFAKWWIEEQAHHGH